MRMMPNQNHQRYGQDSAHRKTYHIRLHGNAEIDGFRAKRPSYLSLALLAYALAARSA